MSKYGRRDAAIAGMLWEAREKGIILKEDTVPVSMFGLEYLKRKFICVSPRADIVYLLLKIFTQYPTLICQDMYKDICRLVIDRSDLDRVFDQTCLEEGSHRVVLWRRTSKRKSDTTDIRLDDWMRLLGYDIDKLAVKWKGNR